MTDEQTKKPGTYWKCCACGKRSNDQYGNDPIDGGWDESCMLNAIELDAITNQVVTPLPQRRPMQTFNDILDKPLDTELLAEARKALERLERPKQLDPEVAEVLGKSGWSLYDEDPPQTSTNPLKIGPDVDSVPTWFTFEEVAHFNRCLFPEGLKRDLMEHGLSEADADECARIVAKKRNIVDLYQECISCKDITRAINAVMRSHIAKFPNR
jgi:hypothetical protein